MSSRGLTNHAPPGGQLTSVAVQTSLQEVSAILEATDAGLEHLSLAEVEDLCSADDSPVDERLWPPMLQALYEDPDPSVKRSLHQAVEIHYGALMRDAVGQQFWRICALAYTRVIPLRLGYDESMGHRAVDSVFVLRSARQAFPGTPAHALRVLDVGCGTGELLADLTRLEFRLVAGIDVSQAAIARAAARLDGSSATLTCMSLRRLMDSEVTDRYDVLTLCDVIEHLPSADVPEILRSLRRLIAPAGLLLVMTPSAITGPHDLDFLPRARGHAGLHLHEYRLRELRSILIQAGYTHMCSSLVAPSRGWLAAPSSVALMAKLALEPILDRLPFAVAARVSEDFYFRGIVCRNGLPRSDIPRGTA